MDYASGVLIISIYKNELYALLGKDHYGKYSDFGGSCEKSDHGMHIKTAARECYEETCGCIFSEYQIQERLRECKVVHSKSYTNKPYFMYVMMIPMDHDIPSRFSSNIEALKINRNTYPYREKTEIRWIKLSDIYDDIFSFRNVFMNTMTVHRDNIFKIASIYMSTYTCYTNGR